MTPLRELTVCIVAFSLFAYAGMTLMLITRRGKSPVWYLLTADSLLALSRTLGWLTLALNPVAGQLFDHMAGIGLWILISQTLQAFVMWAIVAYVLSGNRKKEDP